MVVRARVHDGSASASRRWLATLLGGATMLLVLSRPYFLVNPKYSLFAIGGMLMLAAPLFGWRPRTVVGRVDVDAKRGRVRVVRSGLALASIAARDVVAARVVPGAEGASLVLERRGGRAPVLLELRSEVEAREILAAVGVRSERATWPLRSRLDDAAFLVRLAGLLAWPLYYVFAANGSDVGKPLFGILGLGCMFVALLLDLVRRLARRDQLIVSSEGIRIVRGGATTFFAADRVVAATTSGTRLQLTVRTDAGAESPTETFLVGLPRAADAEHCAAQAQELVTSRGPAREETATHATLRREPGEPVASWLKRIDRLADGGDAYRSVRADRDALAAVLADDEADADARAAAARLLARLDPKGDWKEAVHAGDAAVRRRVRIAVSAAADEAAEEYEELPPVFRARGVSP